VTENEFIREITALGFYPLTGYGTRPASDLVHDRLSMMVDLRGLRRRATYRRGNPYLSALAAIAREISKLDAIDQLALLGDTLPTEVEQGLEEHDL